MRIGLVSDTHGLFDPLLPHLFEGCERILHAGDVVGAPVLAALARIAPLMAVRGNNDRGGALPESIELDVGALRVVVLHELGKPDRPTPWARARSAGADIVVFGHSHQPVVEEHSGVLYVNPGSAGPRRFKLPRCAGILEVEARRAHVTIVDLEASLAPRIDRELELAPRKT